MIIKKYLKLILKFISFYIVIVIIGLILGIDELKYQYEMIKNYKEVICFIICSSIIIEAAALCILDDIERILS